MTKSHLPLRILIVLRGTTRETHGNQVEKFVWSHEHKAHLYLGREFSVDDFPEYWDAADAAYRNFGDGIVPVVLGCRWRNLEKARLAMAAKAEELRLRQRAAAVPALRTVLAD